MAPFTKYNHGAYEDVRKKKARNLPHFIAMCMAKHVMPMQPYCFPHHFVNRSTANRSHYSTMLLKMRHSPYTLCVKHPVRLLCRCRFARGLPTAAYRVTAVQHGHKSKNKEKKKSDTTSRAKNILSSMNTLVHMCTSLTLFPC